MELMIIIVQEQDYPKLSSTFIHNRVMATKFSTEGLYLNKKNTLTVSQLTAVWQETEDFSMHQTLLRKRSKRLRSWMLLQKKEDRAFHRWHFPGC